MKPRLTMWLYDEEMHEHSQMRRRINSTYYK